VNSLPASSGSPKETHKAALQAGKEVALQARSAKEVPIVFHPLPQDDPKQRCPDISKARRILHWEPKVELAEGLRLTLDYFQARISSLS